MVKKTAALMFFGLVLAWPLHADTQAQTLFDQAMIKESGERDPEAARKLYQEVIDQAGDDHRLAARARLHMGACLEQLGKREEAEQLYLQIINESASSIKEAVQAAQSNLERLHSPAGY
jgi:tetratricopeptide (TPR) repeat protein